MATISGGMDITISNLLQHEGSTLTHLYLSNTGMGDQDVEIIVTSLKHNTKLKELNLGKNTNITVKGRLALLMLLNDISSIERIYNSNHTLIALSLHSMLNYSHSAIERTIGYINLALQINGNTPDSHAAGRTKVIKYQLDSLKRKELSQLQGVEYSSIGNLFANIEPVLLPDILALISSHHGQSEFYTTLTQTAPNLLSYIDRKAMVQDALAKTEAQGAALKVEYERKMADINDKKADLSSRLALIDLGDIKQSAVEKGNEVAERSKKRQRS